MNYSSHFKRVAVVGRRNSPDLKEPIETLVDFLSKRDIEVSLEDETARMTGLTDYPMRPADALGENTDLVIVVGGDGTMLSFARRLAPFNVPLLGVNQGRLGFLTDIPQAQMKLMISEILNGRYVLEDRFMLMAQVERGPRNHSIVLHAVNDVVLGRSHTNSLVDFSIEMDGHFVYNLRADGLIVATPTGSTAYALSAGGPILSPQLAAFVLVPVAPYGLTHRPIVVPATAKLRITIRRCETIYLYADGQTQEPVHEGEHVTIHTSPHRAHLIHPENHYYFDALRYKLHWSQTPERMLRQAGLPH